MIGTQLDQGRGRDFPFALSPNAALYNLRDYGGYRTASGETLRSGCLFRSGQFDDALLEDSQLLSRLGVSRVIDLRSAKEMGDHSSPAFDGFTGEVLAPRSEDGIIPHAIGAIVKLDAPDQVREHMLAIYRALPGSGRFRESLRIYFAALAQGGGASLIHCFAGKDRTGLAVALFHLSMGVHIDDVFADYLLTNAAGEVRIAGGLAVLQRQAPADANEAVLREALAVREDYLAAALAVVSEEMASPAAWVLHATGLGEGDLQAVRSSLLS